jgi:transketolase
MVTPSRDVARQVPRPQSIAGDIRRLVIEHSFRAHVGHIGSSLSIAEILAALYGSVLRGRPDDPDRDLLVLSKGHAALGLFAALVLTGRLDQSELDSFGEAGSRLGVHPEPGVPGVDFGTGSLGQGLAVGAGAALAARMQGRESRSFVILSDAELNEGSVWETAQFAGHHRLRNLVAVVDLNGQQAFGNTADVLSIPDPAGAFAAFGWEVATVDGHDEDALVDALDVVDRSGPPRVVIAKTLFGCGVSFMERQLKWHYLPLDDEQYQRAMAELHAQ